MPTGYTAKLMEEGQTFEEYALTCARAFGALITLRDDPLDKPIPERFEASDYSAKRLASAKAELERLESMRGNERIAFGEQQRTKTIAHHREWLERERAQNERLKSMREQVEAYQPPSPEHVEYRAFMLQQIDISMNDTKYVEKALKDAEERSPADFYAAAVREARRDAEYHTKAYAEEVERTEGRNRWIRQLRDSLASHAI